RRPAAAISSAGRRAHPSAAAFTEPSFHYGFGPLGGGEPAHHLLHHVALHVAEEQLLLRFLRQDLGVVVGHVARELHDAGGHVLATLAVVHAVAHPVADAKFAHPPRPGQREDDLLARLAREL